LSMPKKNYQGQRAWSCVSGSGAGRQGAFRGRRKHFLIMRALDVKHKK
jgi:hypothetical protein